MEIVTRPPCAALRGSVVRLIGYAEHGAPPTSVESAEIVLPLIFSFGTPWRIALGDGQHASDWPTGFAAGLFPGPVRLASDGAAACVQADFTPAGAVRLFGGAAAEMAGAMVDLDALPEWGVAARALRDRLAETAGWHRRFVLVESFIASRLIHRPAPEIAAAWASLSAGCSVAETARAIGWSTRHLAKRFRAETGLAPVTASRMLRFRRATELARRGAGGWADISAAAGFADQSHLIRVFRDLAGATPTAWASRNRQTGALTIDEFRNLQDGGGTRRQDGFMLSPERG